MKITDIFPHLNTKPEPSVRRNLSWTKKGPGRRHNFLTAKQQSAKEKMMIAGLSATQAYETLGVL